ELVSAADWMRVGISLIVEVVQQPSGTPHLELVAVDSELVLAVPRDRSLDGQAVAAQRVGLGPVTQQLPGIGSGGHGPRVRVGSGNRRQDRRVSRPMHSRRALLSVATLALAVAACSAAATPVPTPSPTPRPSPTPVISHVGTP